MTYFRVLADDKRYVDRWFLDEPRDMNGGELCAREFTYGQPYVGPTPVLVPILQPGRQVAFNLAAFDMPVVSSEIGIILHNIAGGDIQRFPVTVGNTFAGFEIVNAISQERCVDEARSHARKWGPEDGRPDKIGHYVEFDPLVIDPGRTSGRHILRIWGSLVELIVSEKVKSAMENIRDLGVVFAPVSSMEAARNV